MTTSFKINGTNYEVNMATLPPDITLNTFIREHAQLTATKFMCLEGGCGACIVVVQGRHPAIGAMRTWAANSCLTLLNTCADWEITTAEGVGNQVQGYHPIQKRLAKMNGTQCGFCSPGMVMNMFGLLQSKAGRVTMAEVENAFGGNLCRCTGYRPILDAMKSFAVDSTIGGVPDDCKDIEDLVLTRQCPRTGEICAGSCHQAQPRPCRLSYADGTQWYWPKDLKELFDVLGLVDKDEFMLVAGNTAHGVYRHSGEKIRHFIDLHGVSDLHQITLGVDKLTLGANVTLSEAMETFLEAAQRPGFEFCQQLWNHFDLIANVPVRNTGTLAGNISIKKAHAEFPSDVFITFEALDVHVVVNESATSQRTMSLSEYLKTPSQPTLVLTAFELKARPKEKFVFNSYKIMPRAQNAHAYVNAAFLLAMDRTSGQVTEARICFGGIAPNFVHATALETLLVGRNLFDKETVAKIFDELPTVLTPNSVLPDASPEYRRKLACGLFYKFLLGLAPDVREEFKSGGDILRRPLSSGKQSFETNKKTYPVTQPVEKVEALIQTTGEATYMNDLLTTQNSVYCAFVGATKVGAIIEQIDSSEALKIPGVLSFYSAKDISGDNTFMALNFKGTVEVEEIFCAGRVKYYDQPLGVIAATSSDIANRAVAKVRVIYSHATSTDAVVLPTIDDVLATKRTDRFHMIDQSKVHTLSLAELADISGRGILQYGSQYHFTMEPQTTIAVPFEHGLQIWSSTQWMDMTQCVIARMLQLKIADVQLRVRRLGGAYGAKVSRGNQAACAAALVAYKLNRPARFVQTIESMMRTCGKRWACRSDYEFRATSSGRIVGLRNSVYTDAGCTLNESAVVGMLTRIARNCYLLTDINYKLDVQAVLTDAPSSTWCRAPGSIEGIAMIESQMEHIAFEANIDPADVRLVNLKPWTKMAVLLPRFLKTTEYRERRREIDEYNEKNRWRKRGLGLAIIDFTIEYIDQFTATVAIYHGDGTVVISHGGIEMGQGLNTKVTQVAAYALGIPLDMVKVEASDTINGANSFSTVASIGSEVVCFVVRKACRTLNDRLKLVRLSLKKDATWSEVIKAAFEQNVNLIASDYYKNNDMLPYHVYGLGLTEVEVDILTGNHLIRRVDILEDTGESLSPNIDIGQIEGAFVMGLGYWLTEQLVYDRQTGELLTDRTWSYKPPGAKDIPIDFRIEMLQKSTNTGGFMGSKTTGEPPSCLAVSSIFAIQHALQSARKDAGLKREWLRLGAPTTPEDIVLNAGSDVNSFSLQ